MRKNTKNLAKCGEFSYVECRTKCAKRDINGVKCEHLKRKKITETTEIPPLIA